MRPAVDAAKQDVDIATKVDDVAPAVQAAADAAKDGLGDIEIDDDEEADESGDDASTTASMTEKIQKYAESSSNYLSNVALASAGTALVAPPSAPITLPVSKLAGWAGTAADVVALGAAIVNDDKEGMMKNGAATAIGVGAFFIPGGEGAKLLGKEAATETVKVAAKEGAEAVTKEISKEVAEQIAKEAGVQVAELAAQEVTEQAIKAATEEVAKKAIVQTVARGAISKAGKNIYAQVKRDELLPDGVFTSKSGEQFSEEELRQIGEAAIQKTAEKTASELSNKTGDDFESVTDKASEEVGMLDKIKSFFGFESESTGEEESKEPQIVTLNNSTPKIQQLANAFANLSDEQYDRLRQVIDAEIEKAKTEQNPWQDLPQGFQEFDGSSAILMFEPSQDNMMTLTPEVSGIIPINDDTGQLVDFTVEKQEVIDSKEEIDKMDQKLKEKEKMSNQKMK